MRGRSKLIGIFISSLIYLFSFSSADDSVFDPEKSIIKYIKEFEVDRTWAWVDLYGEDSPDGAPYSPRKIIPIPERETASAKNLLKGASFKSNSKNFNGEFKRYAIIFRSKNGESFGLLRDPSTEGGFFQFIKVDIDDEQPFIKQHVSFTDISKEDGKYILRISGVYLPKYSDSEISSYINTLNN